MSPDSCTLQGHAPYRALHLAEPCCTQLHLGCRVQGAQWTLSLARLPPRSLYEHVVQVRAKEAMASACRRAVHHYACSCMQGASVVRAMSTWQFEAQEVGRVPGHAQDRFTRP